MRDKNISLRKNNLRKKVITEKYKRYFNNRPMNRELKRSCDNLCFLIREEYYKNVLNEVLRPTETSPEEIGGVGGAIASGGEFTANSLRALADFEMGGKNFIELLGGSFLQTLKVDIARFLFSLLGIDSAGLTDIFSQALASIKIRDWPGIIQNWEESGCERVTDAIMRGIGMVISRYGSDHAMEKLSTIPWIGSDISQWTGDERLFRMIRHVGVDAVLDFEGSEIVRAGIRSMICDLDLDNINIGNISDIFTSVTDSIGSLPGVGALLGGGAVGGGLASQLPQIPVLPSGESPEVSQGPPAPGEADNRPIVIPETSDIDIGNINLPPGWTRERLIEEMSWLDQGQIDRVSDMLNNALRDQ